MPVGYVPVVLGALLGIVLCLPRVRMTLNRWINRPSPRRFLAWTVGTGFLLRLLTVLILPTKLVSDQGLIHASAIRILAGEGFGKTAFGPPGQSWILAAWYWLTIPHSVAAYLLGVLLGTAAIWLAYAAASRIVSPLAARWAAILTAVMPTLVFTSAMVHTPPLLVLLVLGAIILSLDAAQSSPNSWWSVLGLGILLGVGALIKPIFLPVPMLILGSWLWLGLGRVAIHKFLLLTAIAALIVAPWTIRNYLLFDAFIPVSSNSGYVLYHGLNPESDGMWSPALRSIGHLDEIEKDRLAREAAFRQMRDHPQETAILILRKQAYMWGTSSTNIATRFNVWILSTWHAPLERVIKLSINVCWTALMVLCFHSTWVTGIWKEPKMTLGVMLLYYTFVLHLFFEVQSRYHIHVIPILIILATAGMVASTAHFEKTANER
jgi:4-amino-4-deoxy-L-arabinose transferase-like glycosyltransferase